MQGFGDFADIDVDKLLKTADEQFAKMGELQKALEDVVGRATDEDGLVTAGYSAAGLAELELHPKAMRLSSGELAEKIKEVIRAANDDLQNQVGAAMSEAYGEEDNPMRMLKDPESVLEPLKNVEADYNRTFENVMTELDAIRRRLNL
ncbi:YbaB/EbfC family nucleoid-associated protein [Nonomuraea typhae]|uniref:YbaB/EbfC family nucleoid-associated protein n=1 Tax=Nonomuraea typhae TaxID=2603600 RepID=UPI0012F837EB|nr:YbaB/EbfC family nucleoid-associated protein [Nonomuraea typhae]